MDRTSADGIRAIERRALARAQTSPSGVGAAIADRIGVAGPHRDRFRIRLADGRYFGWLEVSVGVNGPRGQELEAAIERCAGDLPVDGRLEALEALSPMVHPAG